MKAVSSQLRGSKVHVRDAGWAENRYATKVYANRMWRKFFVGLVESLVVIRPESTLRTAAKRPVEGCAQSRAVVQRVEKQRALLRRIRGTRERHASFNPLAR